MPHITGILIKGSGKCVQICPSNKQSRDAEGRCRCGLGGDNQSCVQGTTCANNSCGEVPPSIRSAETKQIMQCPTEFPFLLEYAPQKKYFCYQNADGNTTGKGGLCNCDCANCGTNSSYKPCTAYGAKCNTQQLLSSPSGLATARGKYYMWGQIDQNILWQGEKGAHDCATACDGNPACTAYEVCNNGVAGPGCRGCYLINKPNIPAPGGDRGPTSSGWAQSKEGAKNALEKAAADRAANAKAETELQKDACLAGCKLSEAYLEPTAHTANVCEEGWKKISNANGCQYCSKDGHLCTINTGKGPCGQAFCTGDVQTKKISSCGELGRDCNTVSHWNGCANSDQCAGPEIFCREGDRRCLTDADCTWANSVDGGNRDCTRIPRSGHCPNSTCTDNPSDAIGVGIEADGTNPWVAGESSAWNVNNQKQICVSRGMCFNAWKTRWPGAPDGPWCFKPEPNPSKLSINAVAACQESETRNATALNQKLGGRDLTQEYTNLDSTYLSDGQSNILLADSNSIDGRMDNIVRRRQELNTLNNLKRQGLENTLQLYTDAWKNLHKNEQGTNTLTAMTEDGKLKRNSWNLKYYIWLGLAICALMIAIRQLKK